MQTFTEESHLSALPGGDYVQWQGLATGRWRIVLGVSILLHAALIWGLRFDPWKQGTAEETLLDLRVTLDKTQSDTASPIDPHSVARPRPPASIVKPPVISKAAPAAIPEHIKENAAVQITQRDWQTVARDYIKSETEKDQLDQWQRKIYWVQSPSLMFGPPPEFFADRTLLAGMAEAFDGQGALLLNIPGKKYTGLGIPLNRSCYLGMKFLDLAQYEKLAGANRMLSSLRLFECDF